MASTSNPSSADLDARLAAIEGLLGSNPAEAEARAAELLVLGLPWDPACLDFRRTDAMVETASVWQVREDLHERSSGRWRNYESRVDTIRGRFPGRA